MADVQMDNIEIDLCIRNIASGDKTALKQLYDEFKKPIFLFALSIVKNYQLAEDAMQDTFLNLVAYISTYHPGTKPKAWIFSIARNASIQMIKKARNKEFYNIEDFEDDLISPDELPSDTIETIESLKTLKPQELEIVSLYVFGGLKQTEIAKVLNLPYVNVRSKYNYAIKKLKQYYLKRSPL